MTWYALDTDTLTLFQRGHALVAARVSAAPAGSVAITVLSVEEQLSGWYTQVRKAKDEAKLAWAYARLAANIRLLKQMSILDYTLPAHPTLPAIDLPQTGRQSNRPAYRVDCLGEKRCGGHAKRPGLRPHTRVELR